MSTYLPATDMPRFVRELMEFVGLDEGDVAAIRRSAGVVPARLLVGAMSLAQTALAGIFAAEIPDAAEALEASVAWNKLLLVHLNVLLLGYLPRSER